MIEIKKDQRGFIALMTVIIMSAALLIIMSAAAMIIFRSRFGALDYENKDISNALAQACVQQAMVNIIQEDDYAGNDKIIIEPDVDPAKECLICKVGESACPEDYAGFKCWMLYARAKYQQGQRQIYNFTNFKTAIGLENSDSKNFDIISREEKQYDAAEFGDCLW